MRDEKAGGAVAQEFSVEIAFCTERQRLRDVLFEAIQQLTMIQDVQVATVMGGDVNFAQLDILIQQAQAIKNQAKYAYISHVELHGCR